MEMSTLDTVECVCVCECVFIFWLCFICCLICYNYSCLHVQYVFIYFITNITTIQIIISLTNITKITHIFTHMTTIPIYIITVLNNKHHKYSNIFTQTNITHINKHHSHPLGSIAVSMRCPDSCPEGLVCLMVCVL